jgi:hypothetical protein
MLTIQSFYTEEFLENGQCRPKRRFEATIIRGLDISRLRLYVNTTGRVYGPIVVPCRNDNWISDFLKVGNCLVSCQLVKQRSILSYLICINSISWQKVSFLKHTFIKWRQYFSCKYWYVLNMIRWNTDTNYNVLLFLFWMYYFGKKLRLQLIVQPTDYSAVLMCARASLSYLFLPTFFVVNACVDVISGNTSFLLKSPAKVGNQ